MQLLPLTLEVRDIKREQQSGAEQGYSPQAQSKHLDKVASFSFKEKPATSDK